MVFLLDVSCMINDLRYKTKKILIINIGASMIPYFWEYNNKSKNLTKNSTQYLTLFSLFSECPFIPGGAEKALNKMGRKYSSTNMTNPNVLKNLRS